MRVVPPLAFVVGFNLFVGAFFVKGMSALSTIVSANLCLVGLIVMCYALTRMLGIKR